MQSVSQAKLVAMINNPAWPWELRNIYGKETEGDLSYDGLNFELCDFVVAERKVWGTFSTLKPLTNLNLPTLNYQNTWQAFP